MRRVAGRVVPEPSDGLGGATDLAVAQSPKGRDAEVGVRDRPLVASSRCWMSRHPPSSSAARLPLTRSPSPYKASRTRWYSPACDPYSASSGPAVSDSADLKAVCDVAHAKGAYVYADVDPGRGQHADRRQGDGSGLLSPAPPSSG